MYRVKASRPLRYKIRDKRISKVTEIFSADKKERERLKKFHDDLVALGDIPSSLDEITVFRFLIEFLNVVSFFQDEGELTCRPKHLKEQEKFDKVIEKFRDTIKESGRETTLNRTKKGEKVNSLNVYIENERAFAWMALSGRKFVNLGERKYSLRTKVVSKKIYPFIESNLKILILGSEVLSKY